MNLYNENTLISIWLLILEKPSVKCNHHKHIHLVTSVFSHREIMQQSEGYFLKKQTIKRKIIYSREIWKIFVHLTNIKMQKTQNK